METQGDLQPRAGIGKLPSWDSQLDLQETESQPGRQDHSCSHLVTSIGADLMPQRGSEGPLLHLALILFLLNQGVH